MRGANDARFKIFRPEILPAMSVLKNRIEMVIPSVDETISIVAICVTAIWAPVNFFHICYFCDTTFRLLKQPLAELLNPLTAQVFTTELKTFTSEKSQWRVTSP